MGSKSSVPAAPDYTAAAQAQGVANKDAATATAQLSNPNIISPYGNQTVSYNPVPKFDQAGYDQALGAYNSGQPTTTFDQTGYDKALAAYQKGSDVPPQILVQMGGEDGAVWMPNPEYKPGPSGPAPDRSAYTTTTPYSGTAPDRSAFTTYDSTNLQPTVTQTLTPAGQQTLDSQQQVQQDLAKLAQQGIGTAQSVMGTPFNYDGKIQTSLDPAGAVNYGPSADQYGLASGGPAADKYGLASGGPAADKYGLASGTLDLSNVAKMPVNAGQTGQAAIMSRLQPQIEQGDNAYAAQLANQGIAYGSQAFDNAMRVHNQSKNDLVNQAALYGIGLDLTANNQGFNQALQSGQFGNQAIAQNFGQGQAATQLGNQAIAQNFGQGQAATQLGNQAIAQNYGQGANSAQLQNAAQNQVYNQGLQSAQFGNTAQAQNLQQQLALRSQPLNEISALMSGSQIQNPQFQAYQGTNIAPPPIYNAAQQQYNAGLQGYGMENAANNSFTNGLFNLGSSYLMGNPFGKVG